jgi:hypothetical protein
MALLTTENAKTIKGVKKGFITAILYLSPYDISGVNVCPNAAAAGCNHTCLNTAGRGRFSSVQAGRLRKTRYLFERPAEFFNELAGDIAKHVRKAEKDGLTPLVRLNGTSDILWERKGFTLDEKTAKRVGRPAGEYANIFELFPDVQFYDYTKIPHRFGNVPANYDLTFSYSGVETYQKHVIKALRAGARMAVVFRDKARIPSSWSGLRVVDGDDTDIRHLDPQGVIVALYAKGNAKHDTTGFVVDVPDVDVLIAAGIEQ